MNLLFSFGTSSLMPHPSNPLRTARDYKVGHTRRSHPVDKYALHGVGCHLLLPLNLMSYDETIERKDIFFPSSQRKTSK
jgi:hypothetical protein